MNTIEYNTELDKLRLPEYGRNIQRMVSHAISIEDRAERQKCAEAIIAVMGNLFPHLRDVNDFKHKLWDHLAIISDFKLDIDYPCEVIRPDNLYSKPEIMPYPAKRIKYKHYGHLLESFIDKTDQQELGQEELIELLANQMKKSFVNWNNKGEVEDNKIFNDLYLLSDHKINVPENQYKLRDVKDLIQAPQQSQQKKKKQRRPVW